MLAVVGNQVVGAMSDFTSRAFDGNPVGARTTPCVPRDAFRQWFPMLVLATLMLPVAASAETITAPSLWKPLGNPEKVAQGGRFFDGCRVETLAGPPGSVNLFYTILQGTCLGHSFSREGTEYPNACLIGPADRGSLGVLWYVHHCRVDGKLAEGTYFDANHRLVDEARLRDASREAGNADYLKRMTVLEAEAKTFFAGCTIVPASVNPLTPATLQGRCLGHRFSHDLPDDSNAVWACQFGKSGGGAGAPSFWSVRSCNYDGKAVNDITFMAATGQQFSVASEYTTVAQWRAADQAQEAAVAAKRNQAQDAAQARLRRSIALRPQVCSDAKPAQASGQPSTASIYGLVLGAPPPCLEVCTDEVAGNKQAMCYASAGPRLTPWGTQRFSVHLNSDALDFASVLLTGDPVLEFLDAKLVGIRFDDIRPSAEENMVARMSAKFGNSAYQSDSDTYSWITPSASVRYAVSDHLGLGGIIGAFVAADAGDGLGTLTLYTPAVRAQVDKYEAEQDKLNAKPEL